ncbi:MAG: glycoside hydrolase family 5 protein, partial [Ruminococcus sp.]|nr:glycoside hydrolase family 5 protein [Ruminococcus sp.]
GAAARGANVVRIVCADGLEWNKTSLSQLNNIINWCKNNKVICILEVHDGTGSNDVSVLNSAVNYWIEMKSALQGNEKYVILNIANEWFGAWNRASEWAEGYKSAIKSIRNAGINNMIMVDAAGYGQWPSSIFQKGTEVFNADPNKNTVFSIHMYQDAGGSSYTVKSNIDQALALNIPVVIGEFADDHYGSNVDEQTIMSYCTEKNVGYLGWSWKGNGSGLETLDIANDWSGSSLSTWGDKLFNGTYGITKTSKTCSIYTGIIEDSSSKTDSSSSSGSGSMTDATIAQGGSASLSWDIAYALDFNLSGYDSAKIVIDGNANQLKLAVDPGWVELVYTTDVYGNYEYNFSASDMSKFSGNYKLYVQGQGSVNSVKIIGSKELPVVPDSSSKAEESSSKADESSSTPDDSSLPEVTGTPEYVSTNLTLSGIIGANTYYTVPDGYVNDHY